jgi:hypothetical protein
MRPYVKVRLLARSQRGASKVRRFSDSLVSLWIRDNDCPNCSLIAADCHVTLLVHVWPYVPVRS